MATCVLASLFFAAPVIARAATPADRADATAGDARAPAPRRLTANDVAREATRTSFAVEQKRHELDAARARLDESFVAFFPRLSFTGSYFRLSPLDNPALGNLVVAPTAAPGPLAAGTPLVATPLKFESLQNATTATSTLTVPLSDYFLRIAPSHGAAAAQVDAACHGLVTAARGSSFEARSLYYEWVRAQLQVTAARDNAELSRAHLARVKTLAAADSASEADVARVEATLASAELVLAQAENLSTLLHERIALAMHDGSGTRYAVGETFETPLRDVESVDVLLREAQRRRPELAAAEAKVTMAEKQASVAGARLWPRLDAVGQLTTANPNSRRFPQEQVFTTTWQVGLQVTMGPNEAASGLAERAEARARMQAAEAELHALEDAIRHEVHQAVTAHKNAQASTSASVRRLAAAETSYRARHERFLADKATTVELTEAQTELFRARLEVVDARVGAKLALDRVAYATGRGEP